MFEVCLSYILWGFLFFSMVNGFMWYGFASLTNRGTESIQKMAVLVLAPVSFTRAQKKWTWSLGQCNEVWALGGERDGDNFRGALLGNDKEGYPEK